MNNEVVEYIKREAAGGASVLDINSSLLQKGWSQPQVDEAFKMAMAPAASSEAADVTRSQPEAQIAVIKTKSKFDLTRAFLLIGVLLIGIAVIVVITSQWSNVGHLGRIMFLLLPMACLYAMYWALRGYETFREVAETTFLLGTFILPFFIGTFIYQIGLIGTLDSFLFFVTAIIALPIYLLIELTLKKRYLGIFTITTAIVALVSLANHLDLSTTNTSWLGVLLAVVIVAVGVYLASKQNARSEVYFFFGVVALLAFFYFAVMVSLSDNLQLEYKIIALLTTLFGLLYICLVPVLNGLYQSQRAETYYRTKRLLEETLPLLILLPLLFVFDDLVYSFMALAVSGVMILLSTKIWTKALIFYGVIGTVFSLMAITNTLFGGTVTWSIIIFIIGFSAIGLGLLAKKIIKDRGESNPALFYGFGIIPEVENMPAKNFFA